MRSLGESLYSVWDFLRNFCLGDDVVYDIAEIAFRRLTTHALSTYCSENDV